jgi:hypothetical protein
MTEDEKLLTEKQVAEYLNVTVRTVQRWRAEGTGRLCSTPTIVRATAGQTWTLGYSVEARHRGARAAYSFVVPEG